MATPLRKLRVDDETWGRWSEAARERGESVSELIREAVEGVVHEHGAVRPLATSALEFTPAAVPVLERAAQPGAVFREMAEFPGGRFRGGPDPKPGGRG